MDKKLFFIIIVMAIYIVISAIYSIYDNSNEISISVVETTIDKIKVECIITENKYLSCNWEGYNFKKHINKYYPKSIENTGE